MTLADKTCVPCKKGVPPLEPEAAEALLAELDAGWEINEAGHLRRTFKFMDFARALSFASRVGQIAEEEQHHPDLLIAWGKAVVEVWSHKIAGLSEADFVLAAKADRAYHEAADPPA